jgi:glutamine amidotransferase
MIAVVDYGAGNLRSVVNAFETIGTKISVVKDPDELARASAIVLPGVGAFGDCMEAIRRQELVEPLEELVFSQKLPYLGICLGMQFLAEESLEKGRHRGLGWIQGKVELMSPNDGNFRIPHMGWNDISYSETCPLFEGLDEKPVFYFVHSYHLVVTEDKADCVTASCWHGLTVTAAVQKDNIFGVQFHPEKSQENGLKLLENFIKSI